MSLGGFVKSIVTSVNNLGQPLSGRPAVIVAKRNHTSVHGGQGNMPAGSSTTYYVTFEFGHGERAEFRVPSREFGLLAEGDAGTLHFQGTWFRGFDRMADTM